MPAVTPIMEALYRGSRDEAEKLAAAGEGDLDVFEATSLGRLQRLTILLRADPSVGGAVSPDGFTALHYAAFFAQPDAAVLLLRAGAQPDAVAQNDMRVQPLHSAAAGRSLDICRCLLAHGADPDARQHGGWTALHEAAHTGQDALAMLLVACGANVSLANDEGVTAVDLAEKGDHGQLADRLRASVS
jgi:ankyrin repeat protein